MMRPLSAARLQETERYLRMLREGAPPGTLLDVRYRVSRDRLASFFLGGDVRDAARRIARLGQRTDVYVGCAPRVRRRGSREDVAPTSLLWADMDTPSAVAALKAFPIPTMIVNSGSGEPGHKHAHAYWALARPLSVEELESANRLLAAALGADPRCADAARILRPPGTANYKEDPPRPVELAGYSGVRYRPVEIFTALPTPPGPQTTRPAREPRRNARPGRRKDPLQRVTPAEYVRRLTGREPGRSGKVLCPLHEEDTPSLHVYDTPEAGWTCYGCPTTGGRPAGGDIYSFASRLWGVPIRDRDFIELRHLA